MKKILIFVVSIVLLVSTVFAYTSKPSDERLLDTVYERLDDIYEESPEKIELLHEKMPMIQERYSDQKRVSYFLSEM